MKTIFLIISCIIILAFTGDSQLTEKYILPFFASSICISDIDLDGDNDILVAHCYSSILNWSGISILQNNLNESFEKLDSMYLFGNIRNILTINADNNPLLDIVTQCSNMGICYVAVIYNIIEGYNNFDTIKIDYGYVNYISHGDINGDGWQDIVVASNKGYFWGVLFNDTNGGFLEPEYHFVDYPIGDVACGDFNNDGKDEVVIGAMHPLVCYYTDISFNITQLDTTAGQVAICDFDNDGDLDIVGHTNLFMIGIANIKFFENTGNGNFYYNKNRDYNLKPHCQNIVTADINNDNLPDLIYNAPDTLITPGPDTLFYIYPDHIIMGYRINRFFVYYNKGNFTLSTPDTIYVREHHVINGCETMINLTCADLNGNGFNDMVFTRYIGARIPNLCILYNNGSGKITGEKLPTGIAKIQQAQKNTLICYPNPFTEQTTITYTSTPILKRAVVEIFNISGVLIKTIPFNENSVVWNSNNNKPGIYFYRLKNNNFISKTQTMIKIK